MAATQIPAETIAAVLSEKRNVLELQLAKISRLHATETPEATASIMAMSHLDEALARCTAEEKALLASGQRLGGKGFRAMVAAIFEREDMAGQIEAHLLTERAQRGGF